MFSLIKCEIPSTSNVYAYIRQQPSLEQQVAQTTVPNLSKCLNVYLTPKYCLQGLSLHSFFINCRNMIAY